MLITRVQEWFWSFKHQWKTIAIFTLILFVATFLRFYEIDAKSIWYDEIHSIIPTNPVNSYHEVVAYSKGDQPPLFFILLRFWYSVFPYDTYYGKALCALLGILGVVVMFFLGKEIGGKSIGLAAMFIAATNVFHVYYSQELRFYSLLFLLTCVSFLFFIKLVKSPSAKSHIFFTLSSIALLYTHYFGMVVATSQALIFIVLGIVQKRNVIFYLRGFAIAAITLIAFSPWIPTVVQDSKVSSFWIEPPSPLFFIDYFTRYFQGWWPVSFKFILDLTLYSIVVRFFWAFSVKRIETGVQDFHHGILISWLLLTLLLPYLYSIFKIPMLVDRYTLITLPALLLIICIGWSSLKNLYLKVFVLMIFLGMSVRTYHRYYHKFKKPEYEPLAVAIIRENRNKIPVLSREAWHFNYFFNREKTDYAVAQLDSITSEKMSSYARFCVILPEQHLSDSQKAIIESMYQPEKEFNFYQMRAVFYKRIHPQDPH